MDEVVAAGAAVGSVDTRTLVDVPVVRLAGEARSGTAVVVSSELHPGQADTVVLVSRSDQHLIDALGSDD